jgi:multicomponent Na+:H+ antiporter subunit D
MATTTLIQLCILIPACGALFIAASSRFPNLREAVTLSTALGLFCVVAALYLRPDSLVSPPLAIAEPLPGIHFMLKLEPLGLLFAGIASLLWLITSVYTIGYMRGNNELHQTRLYVCFAIALASTMGIALSGNLITLFVFYELLTLSTYPLVAHKQDHDAINGGRIYLGILISTSVGLLLPAIIWVWHLTGTTTFTAGGILPADISPMVVLVLLLMFAYGVGKAALMPIHRWLPEAMVAPTPVSALLHAVAVVKAGVFCMVKIVLYIFGADLLLSTGSNMVLVYIAAFTIVTASIIALRQDNLKRRLAYSTISQLSYITLAVALLAPQSIAGAAFHIASHAFGKITLFFAAGAIYTAAHKTRVSELNGIGHRMPFTMSAFGIASLSMIGLPPAGGFLSKWQIFQGAMGDDHLLIVGVFLCSTLLNTSYLLPIFYAAFFKEETQPVHHEHGEAPWTMVVALSATALLSLILFLWPQIPLQLAAQLPGVGR